MIGSLRKRVTVQSPSVVVDSVGEDIKTWNTEATRWASVEPLQGREFWQAQQVQAETAHRVRMRKVDGMDSTWRLLLGSRVFAIRSVLDPEERGRFTEVMAVEA